MTRNMAASVHQRLLNRAHAEGRPFDELLQYFGLERFLYRLGCSLHAEKFQAMVHMGEINSRMKDFYDVWPLATCFAFDGSLLARAVQETFHQWQTPLQAMPAAFSPAFAQDGAKQTQWQAFVRRLAEARAADLFSEAQLAHAERLTAEREKMERYFRQQEGAVAQIAIENIRQAKQRELLERRHADLAALDRRLTLVPELALAGLAVLASL